jgi:ethanolamine utilization protein EutN
MRIAEVIGRVTLSKWHPTLGGASWRLAVALSSKGLGGDPSGRGEPFVVYDDRGACDGSRIAVSEGGEAAAPFHPNLMPIDSYNAAILDSVEFD